jgi:alkylresorcinol/alkylpyrone synthase
VLLVAIELCTLAFRLDELTKANIVATALFGDGAAACVLRAGEPGIAVVETGGQHTWPNTLNIMGWNADRQGLGVIFDRYTAVCRSQYGAGHRQYSWSGWVGTGHIDRCACHPGGVKIVNALERALALGRELSTTSGRSWQIMREHC